MTHISKTIPLRIQLHQVACEVDCAGRPDGQPSGLTRANCLWATDNDLLMRAHELTICLKPLSKHSQTAAVQQRAHLVVHDHVLGVHVDHEAPGLLGGRVVALWRLLLRVRLPCFPGLS